VALQVTTLSQTLGGPLSRVTQMWANFAGHVVCICTKVGTVEHYMCRKFK